MVSARIDGETKADSGWVSRSRKSEGEGEEDINGRKRDEGSER